MRHVREFGVDTGWWLPLAAILLAIAGMLALASGRLHLLGHGWREPVTLLPGLTIENTPLPQAGVVVTSLQSGSEAAGSGIMVGDGIAALDGHPIGDIADAVKYLKNDRQAAVILDVEHGQSMHSVRLHRLAEAHHGA